MRPFFRAALASLFLFAQAALALHHHEHGLVIRAESRSHAAASIQAPDDCALCAFQLQPRTSAPSSVALDAAPVLVAVLTEVPSREPRVLRRARFGARAPPAA